MNTRLLLYIAGGLIGLVVLLIIVAAACSPRKPADQSSGPVTLTFWSVFDNPETYQPIIDDYQKSHPNIKIEYKKLTYDEYQKTLNEQFAAGKGPDVFSVQNSWMPKFFDKIAPIPEDSYKVDDYKKDFYPAVSDTIKDNRIYGIPITVDVLGMYVNSQLLARGEVEEPPKTWDDLVGNADTKKPNLIPQLTNRQGTTINQSAIAIGNDRVPRAADILALMMLQQKTEMTNADHTQATFNLTQTVNGKEVHLGTDALRFYTSFANPATGNYTWNAQVGDPVTAFARGKVALLIGYTYNATTIERQSPELSYKLVPVPQIAGSEPVNYANYWAQSVAKNSKHQAEAWEFIRYLTDRDQMTKYAEAVKQIPARKDVPTGGNLGELQKQLPSAVTWYKGDADKADAAFLTMIRQVLTGEDPQNAINRSANDLTGVLKQVQSDQ